MVLGLIIGAAIAKGLVEGAHVAKGGMSFKEEEEFDKQLGYRGVNPVADVIPIAKRHGIYLNKKGVLSFARPPKRVMDYVAKYANNPRDVAAFKKNWALTVERQLDDLHEKIRTESYDSKQYDKNLQHRKNNVIPNLSSSKTRIFTIEHWMQMPKSEHKRRVNQIVKETILGEFLAGPPVLRENDWNLGGHTEHYKVKLNSDSGKTMTDAEFKRLYRECCAKVGFEY